MRFYARVFYLIHDNEDSSFKDSVKFEDMNYADWLESQEEI